MRKKIYCLLICLFCTVSILFAQSGFQQNGVNLYYSDGFVGMGTSEPSARLTIKHGDLHVIQTPLNENQQSKTEMSLFNVGVGNKPHKWSIFTTSTAGYYGLSSNSFEICEYPSNSDNSVSSLRRMVFESSRDVQSNPIVVGSRGSLNIGYLPGLKPEDKNDLSVNGNVGIGTLDTQGYKLAVNGTIKAKEIQVSVNVGADHVFHPEYELTNLSDLKYFVEENKHLPDIPSEKQMQTEGLNVNEFQIKLLQKIEELTLYIIKQDETINNQSQQIEHLNQRLNQLNY